MHVYLVFLHAHEETETVTHRQRLIGGIHGNTHGHRWTYKQTREKKDKNLTPNPFAL